MSGGNHLIVGIHHFSLIASSEESVAFYRRLGFSEERRIEREYDVVVLMKGFGVGLEIFIDPRHPKRGNPEPLGLRSLALKVDRIEDMAGVLEAREILTDWNGKRYLVLSDPDGNRIQLCE